MNINSKNKETLDSIVKEIKEIPFRVEVENKEPIEIYEEICLKRGFMMKNKEYDYERGAKAILDDFRKGKLGKIVLE